MANIIRSLRDKGIAAVEVLSGFCQRHTKFVSTLLVLIVVCKGLSVAGSGRFGDFQPLVNGVERLHAGRALYVTDVSHPEYVYSPFVALLLYPAGFLSPPIFRFIWLVVNALAVVALFFVSARLINLKSLGREARFRVVVLTTLATWPWIVGNLFNGQVNPLLMAMAVGGVWLASLGRPVLGGGLLGLALHIKPFPVVFFAPLLVQGHLQACIFSVIFYLGFLLIPWSFFGEEYGAVLGGWFDANREQQTIYNVADWGHQSVSAFVFRLFGAQNPVPFSLDISNPMYLLSIGSSLILCILSLRCIWLSRDKEVVGICISAILWAMLPPTSWKHYYLILVPPIMFLACRIVTGEEGAKRAGQILGWSVALGVLRYVSVGSYRHLFYSLSYCVWIGLATWLFMAGECRRIDHRQRFDKGMAR